MQSARRALCHGNSAQAEQASGAESPARNGVPIESAPKPGDRHVPISHDDEQILSLCEQRRSCQPKSPRVDTDEPIRPGERRLDCFVRYLLTYRRTMVPPSPTAQT